MKLALGLMPYGVLHKVIPALLPYLEESATRSRGRASVDDLIRFIMTGQMQLWVVYEEGSNQVYGHFITEVKDYPQFKMLVIQYAAMEPNHMEQVEDQMQEYAGKYARKMGCVGIEFVGRPGWKKHAEKYGYAVQSVSYQKFFD
jgi:hypothetical protein